MNVLVTDGENRSALAVTRSLGKLGARVIVTGRDSRTIASSSRHCSKGFATPDPMCEGDHYVKVIGELATREAIDFIFPMTEQSIILLNKNRDALPIGVRLACAESEKMNAISDKSALCRLAEQLKVPVPRTIYLNSACDLTSRLAEIDHYPVVVKPAVSRVRDGKGFISGGVMYASCRDDLIGLYVTRKVLNYPSLIQEQIIGPGTGLFTLYDKDRHIALFSHQRLREKPPSGGVSVVCESVPLDEEMVEAADRLLSAVGWTGVAMVEFKRDLRDGKAKLMEINGRFWGSLQLAIACGVDYPRLYLDYLQGKTPSVVSREYSVGHQLKWIFGTLDHLVIRIKGDRSQNRVPGAGSRRQVLCDFLKICESDTTYDVLDRGDFGPFIHEAKLYLRQIFGG